MTDKEQIIINGIDVSECLFYQLNFEEDYDVKIKHFCSNWHNSCESANNSNCYFKQLASKTQECEELKRDYQELEQRHNEVFQEFERRKIECEELKDFARREGNQREIYYKEFLRINSALEEIEEIVNVDFSLPCARTDCTYPKPCKDSLTENGTKCMRFALLRIKDIVQKNKEK